MYTIVQLGITESQLQTLLQGHKIFVERSQFQGNVALPLTKKQATTIASASRGVNLKFSSRQISAYHNTTEGEGFREVLAAAKNKVAALTKKGVAAAAPYVRKGADTLLDYAQGQVPTAMLGPLKPVGDGVVQVGRRVANKLLDKLQKLMGGSAGRMAIDAKMGAGWFDEYLLPGLATAAKIAIPLLGGGFNKPAHIRKAIDTKMGAGWFDEYLLPGLETAAKIATPFIRGGGFDDSISGEGFFTDFLLPQLDGPMKGKGWEPMTQKKASKVQGWGLVL